jgi:signal transduction histidine kinase
VPHAPARNAGKGGLAPASSQPQAGTAGERGEPLRLLVVEDSEFDYELLLRQLTREGFEPRALRVETGEALQRALAAGVWDAVVSDHHLPAFSSTEALRMVRGAGLACPFLIVSGAIGEDVAVAAMRAGADDYLIKGRLERLGPALRNALSASRSRLERAAAQLALAESERELRALADHLQQAVEAERAAIAREIHDDVGGMLTALRFDLAWLERHGDDAVRTRSRQGLETLNQAVLAVQRIMRNLRPPALDAGIVPALEFLTSAFATRTGVDATLSTNREDITLSEKVAITVYRVAQESLTNVAKHANARHARMDLVVQDDTLSLEITDDGVGMRPQDLRKAGSFGLLGLHERVRQVHGWLETSSQPGRSTVIVTIPLTEQAAARLDRAIES